MLMDDGWSSQLESIFDEMDCERLSNWEEQGWQVEEQGQQSGEQGIQVRSEELESHSEQQLPDYIASRLEENGVHVEQNGGHVAEKTSQSQWVAYTPATPALAEESGGLTEREISVIDSISRIEGCGVVLDFLHVFGISLADPDLPDGGNKHGTRGDFTKRSISFL